MVHQMFNSLYFKVPRWTCLVQTRKNFKFSPGAGKKNHQQTTGANQNKPEAPMETGRHSASENTPVENFVDVEEMQTKPNESVTEM